MTDAPDRLPVEPGAPSPRPGSLEHLARTAPEASAIVDARSGRTLTRGRHDHLADALAAGLHAEHGVAAGSRVALALAPGTDLLTVLLALAKLGAAPLLLPATLPVPVAADVAATAAGVLLVTGTLPYRDDPHAAPAVLGTTALAGLAARHAGAPPRLSGEQPPADGVQAAPGPGVLRTVLRVRTPERLARLAPVVGDLLGRVDLPRGGTHLLAGGGHRPEAQFWAGVALVTGGTVATLADDAGGGQELLDVLVDHEVTSCVLSAGQLRALVGLPAAVTGAADLTALRRIVVDDGPLDAALVAGAADLFGDDVLHAVYATTQTGPIAHADAAALAQDPQTAGLPLAGVSVTTGGDGALSVRSPLTADGALGDPTTRGGWPAPPAWQDAPVPTGDRGHLTDDGRVQVTRTAHPGPAQRR